MFRYLSASAARKAAALTGASASAATAAGASSAFGTNTPMRLYSSGNKDYYKILGVDRNAELKDIKKAYRKRALETHPDQGGNKEEFAEVAEAYEVLSSPDKKKVYDQYGSEAATNPNMGAAGGFGGMGGRSAEDIFAEFFRGGMGGMGGFGDMFNGGAGGGRQATPTLQPLEVRTRLTLEDVYKGVTKTIRVNRPQVCAECTGFGTKSRTEKPKCTQCGGSGSVVQQHRMGPGMVQQTISECPRCRGTGTMAKPEDQCHRCHGKGYRTVSQDVTIEIPAGVPSNVTLVVRGEGGTVPGCPPADMHLHVEVGPHRVFQRRGNDLIVNKEVTLQEALLGLHMPLKMLDGRTVNVETTADQVLKPEGVIKMNGEGMPSTTGERGDVYVFTHLKLPNKLSSEQKELISKAFGVPAKDANASVGNTVKARVMRETREQLEEQKRGVWASQEGGGFGGGGGGGSSRRASGGMPGGAQHAECATQ
ncbi:putative mitochondrial chaperone protein DNAj [Leptomonas pyrrhocoris]|uniref:Putative mitochondrial chaperone protein DNAj n=1 Tax=Leptomonas pyrrhocoris TaxID=157538 RepID=A0A0N0E0D1_LEPPY|nr:putative mitochondrial chaperone protein DNAj [Leptomonas pyrrhocoris]KPA86305.1 putative mitochondrial chaperone protein DNAj [Leptomonas pyrrhocoris]|eukprot:XP_015664744.1 putative mitochondrial chaperone protein DNAj [Leptomonas pyrrhocoris]